MCWTGSSEIEIHDYVGIDTTYIFDFFRNERSINKKSIDRLKP